MTSRRTKIFPKSGRGLGHVTATIFGSTVGYPSDSLASCDLCYSVASVSRCLSSASVTLCIVAKRCVLQQNLLMTAYTKSYMRNRLTFVQRSFKVTWTIASHSPLNISETVRDRGLVPRVSGQWGIQWSRERWRHVTHKGQTSDLSTCLQPNISRTAGDRDSLSKDHQ